MEAERFARRVIDWAVEHGRHDLPWQQDADPYRVWVSEIMLQQTQVATVVSYFQRFVDRFPHLASLADADIDEVLALWSGLGYYARARNLHAAAKAVVERHGGVLPADPESLQALPGIGRSTAAAILSLACDQPRTVLDGNIKRVIARHAGVEGWPGRGAVLTRLWQEAERRQPASEAAAYTQGMMDLGAMLCTRSGPDCGRCPVAADCVARIDGSWDRIPAARPKRAQPVRETHMLLVTDPSGALLMERRPPVGIWGGLWCPPTDEDRDRLQERVSGALGSSLGPPRALETVRHTFTHFRLDIRPLHVTPSRPAAVAEGDGWRWVEPGSLADVGVPAVMDKLLRGL